VTRIVPFSSARRAAPTSAGQSAAVAPLRDSPVSILSCTLAGRWRWWAVPAISASAPSDEAVMSTSATMGSAYVSPGTVSQQSTRPVSPAARRAIASSTVATPSHSAPPRRAAAAASTMPCP